MKRVDEVLEANANALMLNEALNTDDNYERHALAAVVFVAMAAVHTTRVCIPDERENVTNLLAASVDRLAWAHFGDIRPDSTQSFKAGIGNYIQAQLDGQSHVSDKAHLGVLAAAAYKRAAQLGQDVSR
jgi:hypothetical protein